MKNANFSNGQGASSKYNNIYDRITGTMIEFLESLKTSPERWERPWILSENGLGAHNAQTKRSYSGVNQLILSYLCLKYGYSFNRWLTFNQVKNLGGKVKRGEKSTIIVFSKVLNKVEVNSPSNDEQAAEISVSRKFILTYYNVFNVSQCEGLGESFYLPYIKTVNDFNTIDTAEDIIKNCKVKIQYS